MPWGKRIWFYQKDTLPMQAILFLSFQAKKMDNACF